MNETYVTIRGRLTADPTVRTTRAGAPMTKIRIAHSARRPVQGQPGQWEDTEASFYDVVTYRSLAANIAVSLRKGHPVTVHGRQRIVSWQRDDGTTRNDVEIEADAVGHDLTFGTAAFSRVGMGRPAESWSPGSETGPEGERPGEAGTSAHLGDPQTDPYVLEDGLGRALGEVSTSHNGRGTRPRGGAAEADAGGAEAVADTGPLVAASDESAA